MSAPPLVDRVRQQADPCRRAGSPLTADLLDGAADDLGAGGAVAALLGPLEDDPAGSVPALRFAGALHRLVLERRAPELALHYPSVGGRPGDVWPVARRAVEEHLDELHGLVRRPVQTNEVGRSSGLLHVAAETGLPVRLLEVGASGGLNLHVDPVPARGGARGPARRPGGRRSSWTPPGRAGCRRTRCRSGCRSASAATRSRSTRPGRRTG